MRSQMTHTNWLARGCASPTAPPLSDQRQARVSSAKDGTERSTRTSPLKGWLQSDYFRFAACLPCTSGKQTQRLQLTEIHRSRTTHALGLGCKQQNCNKDCKSKGRSVIMALNHASGGAPFSAKKALYQTTVLCEHAHNYDPGVAGAAPVLAGSCCRSFGSDEVREPFTEPDGQLRGQQHEWTALEMQLRSRMGGRKKWRGARFDSGALRSWCTSP